MKSPSTPLPHRLHHPPIHPVFFLTSADLKRILAIKLRLETYDRQLLAIYKRAKSRSIQDQRPAASPGHFVRRNR